MTGDGNASMAMSIGGGLMAGNGDTTGTIIGDGNTIGTIMYMTESRNGARSGIRRTW